MGKNKNLKAALHSQQSRLKAKQKLLQVEEQHIHKSTHKRIVTPSLHGKGKGKAVLKLQHWKATIPFLPTDKILLVGEGNFSFTRALVHDSPQELRDLPPQNVTTTAYDTEDDCYQKYPDSRDIVIDLRKRGVKVVFGVDATRLEKIAPLKGHRWDRIVWNFPHAGKGITDQDRNILSNQVLILGFFRSASKMLATGPMPSFTGTQKRKDSDDEDDEDLANEPIQVDDEQEEVHKFFAFKESHKTRGTILITLRNVVPYTLWDVPRLAKKPPMPTSASTPPNPRFTLLRSFKFSRNAYKGYEHRMTKGTRAHGMGKPGEGGEDRTWEFCLQDVDLGPM